MKKIPPDAFDFYFSLGPPRSYQTVADKYGVTKRAVTNLAKREDWQQRLAEIEAKAREEADKKRTHTLDAVINAYSDSLRKASGRTKRSSLSSDRHPCSTWFPSPRPRGQRPSR